MLENIPRVLPEKFGVDLGEIAKRNFLFRKPFGGKLHYGRKLWVVMAHIIIYGKFLIVGDSQEKKG